uniref:E13B n=1 Tax=Arundo donax TaxID=35708 RepID=A0A0A8Z9Q8_ARUDO
MYVSISRPLVLISSCPSQNLMGYTGDLFGLNSPKCLSVSAPLFWSSLNMANM